MRSPPWRASDPSAARASAIRRAVNPSPPAILKDPPCAGFLIWIAEFADLNPVRTEPRLRGELDAQPALVGERPERSEGKRLQARSQSLSPSSSLKSVYWHYLQERLWPRTSSHHIQRLAPQPWAGTLRYFPPWAKINDTVLRPLAYIVDESKQGTDSRIFYLQSEPRACR